MIHTLHCIAAYTVLTAAGTLAALVILAACGFPIPRIVAALRGRR